MLGVSISSFGSLLFFSITFPGEVEFRFLNLLVLVLLLLYSQFPDYILKQQLQQMTSIKFGRPRTTDLMGEIIVEISSLQ